MDGDHDIARCEDVTSWVLSEVFEELFVADVALEGMVLKPNMIIAGKKCARQASVQEVAEATVRVLKQRVPSAVPGIAFLSGGQSDLDATAHLDAINKIGGLPWHVTYSYGRALQHAPQTAWAGKVENVTKAQNAFSHRAAMNSLAALGKWSKTEEQKAS
jgi:fructose-bisphosphate aldolase class I